MNELKRASVWALCAIVAMAAPAGAGAQSNEGVSARELYRKAAGVIFAAPDSKPDVPPSAPPKRRPPSKPPQTRTEAAPQTTNVSLTTKPVAALAMRYWIEMDAGDGSVRPVGTDHVFHSGDRIRLVVEAAREAYFYVASQGSNGNWQVLFPSEKINGGRNLVEGGKAYRVPASSSGWFRFDENVGAERLLLVLSDSRQEDMERFIYQRLEDSRPGSEPELLASARPLDDAFVKQVRGRARNLVFEGATERLEGWNEAAKVTYAASAGSDSDSRVIADVTLEHR
jgi:hypothetical protein